jgi:hypothetical protein
MRHTHPGQSLGDQSADASRTNDAYPQSHQVGLGGFTPSGNRSDEFIPMS